MIRSTYDLNADALYLRVSDSPVARTEQVDEGTLVDLDAHQSVVGIEVLRPGRVWPLGELLERYHIAPEDARLLRVMFPALATPTANDRPASAYEDRAHQFSRELIGSA